MQRWDAAKAEMRLEYLDKSHAFPWIVGFSGGKDSTLVLQLCFEMLMELAPSDRKRPVHVLCNDTLVESPILAAYVDGMLKRVASAADSLRLPVVVAKTQPHPDQTFWVNLIGRGYPSPNRTFRWCTDRMKIQPTSEYIKSQVAKNAEVILLLGVRRGESATRTQTVNKYDNGSRLNPHNDLKGCMIFRPIVDFSTDEVWSLLLQRSPPWGGSNRDLITLYRNAQGGECPLVIEKSQAPSCGTSSSRFGCWTCTVVEKDHSMEGFIDAGFDHLEPLLRFRDWLAQLRTDRTKRSAERRTGAITYLPDGSAMPGPFTLAARQEILDRLLELQREVELSLISDDEIHRVRDHWAADAVEQGRRLIALDEAGREPA
jgi:DNA sulfur modification protein DndC